MDQQDRKELNFELNLLPVISMLSVCICFLLLTAVWTQVGSMNIEQGLGQTSTRLDPKDSSLWVTLRSDGGIALKMMDSPGVSANKQSQNLQAGAPQKWHEFARMTEDLKREVPGLKTALIFPEARVGYGDVVRVMDQLKGLKIAEIGIAPN